MTDIKVVEKEFKFPFTPHDYQYGTVERSADRNCILLQDSVGTGKTAISTYLGLYHSIENGVEQILALMPPALIDQFEEWILSIGGIDPPLVYRGSPAQRKKMDLMQAPVVIMSYNIFRSDFTRIQLWATKRKLFILADELSLKSMRKTYKNLKQLMFRKLRIDPWRDTPFHYLCALNATPVSDPIQVYNWCSIFWPAIYPSQKLFLLSHAAAEDHWGKVTEWVNLDDMEDNFAEFARVSENVQLELPESVYTEIPYALEKKHAALYNDIAEAEFALLPEDMLELAVEALFSTLQRVVLTPKEYGLDIRPPILDIIDQQLDQLGEDDKVILYTRHVSVSKMLQEAYPDAVSYFGAVSKAKKKEGLLRFKQGGAQILIANLESLSRGQNLQVANHTIFVEVPFRSDSLIQACGRTARQGQKRTCFFTFPVAKGTIQRKIYRRLLDNDTELLKFNRKKKALREFIGIA